MRKLKLKLSNREWAKSANPCAPWWLFEIYWKYARLWWRLFLSAVSLTRAVYFPVNAIYFAAKHLKFDSSYSNERFKLLTYNNAHSIVLFPLPFEALSCKLVEQGWSLLNIGQSGNGKSSSQDLNCSIVFFSTSKEKKRPSAVCVNYLMRL